MADTGNGSDLLPLFKFTGDTSVTPGAPLQCNWVEKSIQWATTVKVIAGRLVGYENQDERFRTKWEHFLC